MFPQKLFKTNESSEHITIRLIYLNNKTYNNIQQTYISRRPHINPRPQMEVSGVVARRSEMHWQALLIQWQSHQKGSEKRTALLPNKTLHWFTRWRSQLFCQRGLNLHLQSGFNFCIILNHARTRPKLTSAGQYDISFKQCVARAYLSIQHKEHATTS